MRRTILALALAAAPLGAQDLPPAPGSTPVASSRIVVVFEVSAMPVTNRSMADWQNALPPALLDRITADDAFSGIDLGGYAGNGISVRFHFPDMEAYQLWRDKPETVFMIGELQQIIGSGYSRTGVSMRRVAGDPFAERATPRRNSTPPRPAPAPAPQPRSTSTSTIRTASANP